MLPGTVFALPGGLLGQRYGAKNIVLVGLLLMAIGGALTAMELFPIAVSGRLISGTGAVLINVIMTKMVTDWFAGREIITAMAIFIASWPLGIALALISFPVVAAAASWTAAMYVAASVALLCLILVALIYRDPPNSQAGASSTFRIAMTEREWLLISLAGLIWTAYNVGLIVLISFLPELFTVRGYSLADASRIVSLLGWVQIPSVPLSGYVAERLNRPNLLMVAGFCTVAIAAAVLPFSSAPIAVYTLVVLGIGLPAGLIMALPAQSLQAENRSVGMGIYFTFYYAGMALLPALAGLARDLADSPAATALFASTMMGVALIGLFGFRAAQRMG
jgi:cyanate permease